MNSWVRGRRSAIAALLSAMDGIWGSVIGISGLAGRATWQGYGTAGAGDGIVGHGATGSGDVPGPMARDAANPRDRPGAYRTLTVSRGKDYGRWRRAARVVAGRFLEEPHASRNDAPAGADRGGHRSPGPGSPGGRHHQRPAGRGRAPVSSASCSSTTRTTSTSRFSDPGGWFNCSGTLISPTVVLTAGHCTFGTGHNGASTLPNGWGGNDVWVSFEEEPDYDRHQQRAVHPATTTPGATRPGRRSWLAGKVDLAPRHRVPAPAVRRPGVLPPRRRRRDPR